MLVFNTGLRLRFVVVEFEAGRLFTDESRLPGARMGHRHLVEPTESSGGPSLFGREPGRVYGRKTPLRKEPMAVEIKNFDSPDETRPFEGNGQAKVVQLAGHAVAEGTFEPGWKWSENVKPIAGTDSCQVAHFGYVLSGSMRVFMDDGSEALIKAGDVFAIPPGHDADVPGPEACVMVDFGAIGDYAKRD